MSTIVHSMVLAIAGSLTNWTRQCEAVGAPNMETKLVDHSHVYMEVVTHSTSSWGQQGLVPLGSPGVPYSTTAMEQMGQIKQGGSITISPGHPPMEGEGGSGCPSLLPHGMGWQVQGLGLSPAAGTLMQGGSCTQERERRLSHASSIPHYAIFGGSFRLLSSM